MNAGYRIEGETIVNNVKDETSKVPPPLCVHYAHNARVTRSVEFPTSSPARTGICGKRNVSFCQFRILFALHFPSAEISSHTAEKCHRFPDPRNRVVRMIYHRVVASKYFASVKKNEKEKNAVSGKLIERWIVRVIK